MWKINAALYDIFKCESKEDYTPWFFYKKEFYKIFAWGNDSIRAEKYRFDHMEEPCTETISAAWGEVTGVSVRIPSSPHYYVKKLPRTAILEEGYVTFKRYWPEDEIKDFAFIKEDLIEDISEYDSEGRLVDY